MFQRLIIRIRSSLFLGKLLWTLGIIVVYLFGRSLPLGTVALVNDSKQSVSDFLTNLAAITGGQFFKTTLFSLGLGPWMTSMILWRFLIFFNWFKQLTQKQSHYGQMGLMLIISAIQSLGMVSSLDLIQTVHSTIFLKLVSMLILMSGTYVLTWLARLNSDKGLGGSIVIILANLILTSQTAFISYFKKLNLSVLAFSVSLLLLFFVISLLMVFTLVIYRAEYRLKIRRITIISDFAEATYIPIRLTPAGAMPYMYGMTLMILPPLVLQGLLVLFPDNLLLNYLMTHLSLSQLPGILIYMALLFLLSFGFAFYNYEPLEIAKAMRISGDYVENVMPGKDTERYIRHILNKMTLVGAIITSFIGGFPLLLVLGNPEQVSLALLINNIYIITTMMLGLIEQVEVLGSWRQYRKII